jgi:xanthine dehydrogenase accessory factor
MDILSEAVAPDAGTGIFEKAGIRIFVRREEIIPHAVVCGGSHIGEALLRILKQLKWRVSIVDPRESFADSERFADADALLHTWPQEAFDQITGNPASTAVAAITHNEQMDDEAVEAGLRAGCFYVGVLGSSRTFAARMGRLREKGWSGDQLQRIHGPIGLDIGAETPEEIALSIASEMVRDYRKGEK